MSRGSLIIISAPSGSGKTSLARRTLVQVPSLSFSVSHTTREPRPGEIEDEHYFFVGQSVFESMIEEDAFLEWAHVYGNYYGTGRAFVQEQLEQGQDVLLDIDVQGARKVREKIPEAITVFVFPPSYQELGQRLQSRGLDDPAVIESRLEIARNEIREYNKYDYLIVNDDIEESVNELQSIVLAARCLRSKVNDRARAIVSTFLKEEGEQI